MVTFLVTLTQDEVVYNVSFSTIQYNMTFTTDSNEYNVTFSTIGLQGPPGPTGPQGPQGVPGPAGRGVAPGGTTGQILEKASNADYDTEWVTPAPGGVTSFNTRTGAVVSEAGDYNTSEVTEDTNLYFTQARARSSISGTAGNIGYDSSTGEINLVDTAVTPGSYTTANITVDEFGRVTSASDGAGGVTSFNTRVGAVTSQSGDYTTDQVTEATNLYFTAARVLSVLLTGLSTATDAAITASDSIIIAFGKVQAQINAVLVSLNLKAPLDSPALTGTPTAPTATPGTNTTQLATTAFVEAAIPANLPPSGPAGGDLCGAGSTYPNPILAPSGVTAGTYGSASSVPVETVDAKGRATSITNTPIQITESQVTGLATDLESKVPLAGGTLTGPVIQSARTVAYAATISPNSSTFYIDVTLTGNIAINGPSSPTANEIVWFRLLQDGTGGRIVTWNTGAGNFLFTQDLPSQLFASSGVAGNLDQYGFAYNANKGKWIAMAFNRGAS